MRVAVVAGPDPGHAFPAIALCRRFVAAGDQPILLTGVDDADTGAKIHRRAARMAALNLPQLRDLALDLVVSDVITVCGGMAAELLGLPWVELCPHPLYLPSKGLPPLGSGLAPGVGMRGRLRDSMMRRLTARSLRQGERQSTRPRAGARGVRQRQPCVAPPARPAAHGAPGGGGARGAAR